ncbi:hypothetical protein [Streptomyces cyaneofuscatus]|uniref:hypothetical protein n=1 Tax=Streptomyces cyaneofuscatus TaxID=66883 RepID=UPI0037957ACF
MTGNEADTSGHVCRPASAAEACREVEFALHPLLCSADSYYLRAHRAGFEDKVADQVVVPTLPTGGKTITVAVPLSGP